MRIPRLIGDVYRPVETRRRRNVIPNGLEPAAFAPLHPAWVRVFVAHISPRLLLAKVARFDPDKRWNGHEPFGSSVSRRTMRSVDRMKRLTPSLNVVA
jgi:hypothetical protein